MVLYLRSAFISKLVSNRQAYDDQTGLPRGRSRRPPDMTPIIISLLEQEQCQPAVWKSVAVEYYRQQLYDDFEAVLTRAVDVTTSATSAIPENSAPAANIVDNQPLSFQRMDVCVTLAACYIYKLMSTVTTTTAGPTASPSAGVKPVDVESCTRTTEELLKRAEVILNSALATTPSAATGGANQSLAAGRGAQLVAAARLMLSTSPATSAVPLLSSGGSGKTCLVPQQVAHSETQKKFTELLDAERRQTLSPLLCYAFLYLAQFCTADSEPKRTSALSCAFNSFRAVLSTQADSILAKLGLAAANFAARRFLPALKLYASVLQICPNGPMNLRLAIGVCQFYLGNYDKAEKAFLRVIEMAPGNAEALVGLSAIQQALGLTAGLRKEDEVDNMTPLKNCLMKSTQYLLEAHKSSPNNPLALLGLANAAFMGDKCDLVDKLLLKCEDALSGAGRSVIAEWWYQKGRVRHSRGDLNGAAMDYVHSLRNDHRWMAARFGLTQTCLSLQNAQEAEKHLQVASFLPERVVVHSQILTRVCSSNADVMKLLAYTCLVLGEEALVSSHEPSSPGTARRAQNDSTSPTADGQGRNERQLSDGDAYIALAGRCVRSVLEHNPTDKEALLLCTRSESIQFYRGRIWLLDGIIACYETLLEIDRATNRIPPTRCFIVELVNNLACVLFEACLEAVGSKLKESVNLVKEERIWLKSQLMTIRFNRALALEHQSNHRDAHAAYKQLNAELPGFEEPWQRRCWLSIRRHDLRTAKTHCEQALQHRIDPKELTFMLLITTLPKVVALLEGFSYDITRPTASHLLRHEFPCDMI